MNQGIMALANSGRGEDTHLAHLMKGEVVLPPHILANNKNLKKSVERNLAKTFLIIGLFRFCRERSRCFFKTHQNLY